MTDSKSNIKEMFSKKPKEQKSEGKLSKRIRLLEQSVQDLKTQINIVKSRLGL